MNGTFATFQGRLLYDTDALILEKMEAADAISGGMTIFNQPDSEVPIGSRASLSTTVSTASTVSSSPRKKEISKETKCSIMFLEKIFRRTFK